MKFNQKHILTSVNSINNGTKYIIIGRLIRKSINNIIDKVSNIKENLYIL